MPKEKIKEREAAENFFVEQLWDGKTIAEKLGVQENTISKWREKYSWDKKREEFIANPLKLRRIILQNMLLVATGVKPAVDSDALAKLNKVYETLNDKINPGIVAAVMKLYDDFLLKENPELAVMNLPHNKNFLIHIIHNYG